MKYALVISAIVGALAVQLWTVREYRQPLDAPMKIHDRHPAMNAGATSEREK